MLYRALTRRDMWNGMENQTYAQECIFADRCVSARKLVVCSLTLLLQGIDAIRKTTTEAESLAFWDSKTCAYGTVLSVGELDDNRPRSYLCCTADLLEDFPHAKLSAEFYSPLCSPWFSPVHRLGVKEYSQEDFCKWSLFRGKG